MSKQESNLDNNPNLKSQQNLNTPLLATLNYQIRIKTSITTANDQNLSNMILETQNTSKQQQQYQPNTRNHISNIITVQKQIHI